MADTKAQLGRLPSVCSRSTGPVDRASLRTLSLSKDEFAELQKKISPRPEGAPSLWRISLTARAGGGPGAAPLYQSVSAEEAPGGRLSEVSVDLGRTSSFRPPRHDPPRSLLGLPILSCSDPRYLWWALAVLLLDLTYSAFLVPLSIGFGVNDLDWTWACFVDLVAGAFFAVELFLGFHTSYCATSGGQQREVTGQRAVARYYIMHGSFLQDACSTAIWITQIVLLLVHRAGGVPLSEGSGAFQYIRIVRMVRWTGIVRQLFVLTVGSGAGAIVPGLRIPPRVAHAANVGFSSLVLVHFFACLWNFIAIKEGLAHTWLNPIAALVRRYSADGASVLTAEELGGVPEWHRYVLGIYYTVVTVATLGYGDVVPTNTLEYLVDCVIIAVGVLMFGIAMGSLAEVVANSSKEARQAQLFQDKMERVNSWLHSSGIPRPLRRRIRDFYSDIWLRHAAAKANAAERFLELPHAMRQEVAWELNRRLLQRLPLFRELDDTQRFALSGMLVPVDLTPGMELCLHGDPADKVWLLHEGEVQLFDETEVVHVVSAPAVLGVEALLQHVDAACAARPYGFRTSTACTLWEAPLEDLLPWLLDNTAALDALSARAQRQREALEGAIVLERGAQHAQQAQHTYTPQQAAEACAASGGATAPLAVAQQAAVGLAADGGHDGAATALWAISSSPEPSASQLGQPPAEEAAAHDQLHSAAAAGPAGGGLLQGELAALRQEMVQRLDALAADMRRAMSAASLGQSVAALGGGQGGAGRGGHRASSPGARAEAGGRPRRHHWAFGQITM